MFPFESSTVKMMMYCFPFKVRVELFVESVISSCLKDGIVFSDPDVLSDTLVAHTDAVWSLAIHSSKSQLLSSSADGTVRLWSPGSKSPLLNTFRVDNGKSLFKYDCLIGPQEIASMSSSNGSYLFLVSQHIIIFKFCYTR